MRFKSLCIIAFALAIVFPPLQKYSSWHLRTFSEGFVYTLLNVTYLPYDYKIDSWTGMLETDKPVSLNINHRYKGKYDLYVMGDVVKNEKLNYIVDLNCSSGEALSFNSKSVTATSLLRKSNNEIRLGTYLVEDLDGFQDCMIELTAANFDSPVGVRFLKKTHW